MPLEFIAHRERIETTTYSHIFDRTDIPGAGFGFDCNAAGHVDFTGRPEAAENYRKCNDGTYPVIDRGVRPYTHSYWSPAVVKCECGRRIYLDDPMTNECERCGLLCNGSGQVLAPVSQWEPEDVYAIYGVPTRDADDW